jgi:hypothetical protein
MWKYTLICDCNELFRKIPEAINNVTNAGDYLLCLNTGDLTRCQHFHIYNSNNILIIYKYY